MEEPRPRGVASQDFIPLTDGSSRAGGYRGSRSSSGSSSTNYTPRGNGLVGGLVRAPSSLCVLFWPQLYACDMRPPFQGTWFDVQDPNSPPTRAGRANAERRRSGNYSERRSSGVSEENSRRRSVDMITGAIREPAPEGPPAGSRRASRMAGGEHPLPSFLLSTFLGSML